MKRLFLIWMLIMCWAVLIPCRPSWATRAYVTDTFEITLRTGPTVENKIIAMISSGQPVEVIETRGEWNLVRLPDGSKEGWVFSKYLITRLPWSLQARNLKEENGALQAKLVQMENTLSETQPRREKLAAELQQKAKAPEEIQEAYEALKQRAEGFLKLERSNEMNEAALKAARLDLEKLTTEVERLRSSQVTRWFATGALVLLCGLLLGVMVGRQQKKKKSFYS
jgi:SH3 domain protein